MGSHFDRSKPLEGIAMHEIEFYVLVDENGDFVIHKEPSELDMGELAIGATRLIRVVLNVPTPVETIVVATLPVESNAVTSVSVS
jgi:hypothetical protein